MKTTTAFWDSSALAPLCLLEQASPGHFRRSRENATAVWWGTAVEVHGAIVRFYRARGGDERMRRGALERLQRLWRSWQEILPSDAVRELARVALDSTDLRAADALQLAAALVWCRERPRQRLFLTSDQRLGAAADGAGFAVELL